MNYKGSNQSTIKHRNKRLIFEILLESYPMTRATISSVTGISKPAVSKNVDELISEGFLIESGKEEDASVGKRGINLEPNKNILRLLAIDLSKNAFKFAISNIFGDILHEESSSLDMADINKILENLDSSLKKYNVSAVSISYAGVIKNDEISHSRNSLKELYLEKILPIILCVGKENIIIRNDLNNSVLAERKYGPCEGEKNVVMISCDYGVGAGIIINNMIYEGDSFAAGEIGYINSSSDKDDEYRFLEDRISLKAIEKRYSKKKGKKLKYSDFIDDFKKDKNKAVSLYNSIIDELVSTILTVLSVLDINKCILAGSLFDIKKDFTDILQNKINELSPFKITLMKSTVENSALKGAILTGIDEFKRNIKY